MALTDDLADLVLDDLGESTPLEWLKCDNEPPRLRYGIEGVALSEGDGILESEVKDPLDVGDKDVTVRGGGQRIDGHVGVRCKGGATVTTQPTQIISTTRQLNTAYTYWRTEAYRLGYWWVPVLGWC